MTSLEYGVKKLIKPTYMALFTVFFTLFAVAQTAEAKRFGGGSSFGYSKSVAPKSFNKAPKPAPKAAPSSAAAGAKAPGRSMGMMGILGGMAAGGLLAAMFMGDGFEGLQIMDILLFALIAFGAFKLFTHFARRQSSQAPATQPAYESSHDSQLTQPPAQDNTYQREAAPQAKAAQASAAYNPESGESIFGSALGESVSEDAHHLTEAPAWFDAEQFVEGAKGHFVSLQKAWDSADISEISEYCSPELFEAIKAEMATMQPGDNETVVETLNAELADMAIDGEYFIASIRFTGFIQEDAAEGAHAFNEVWHIRRLANDEGTWQVSGIQQGH